MPSTADLATWWPLVNYPGPTGFGHAFVDSITHRWCALALQDMEAATTQLFQRPYIDPTRVNTTGGSYGGYMVAWMTGHIPGGQARPPQAGQPVASTGRGGNGKAGSGQKAGAR